MTLVQPTHLDDFALAALALGDLPAALGAEARQHLHSCGDCRRRFAGAAAEADLHEAGDEALWLAQPAPRAVQLLEVARPDGGAVLLFPSRAQVAAAPAQPSGISKVAARVFGRFEQLLHAAAGAPDRLGGLEVASGDEVQALTGAPGETLEVWFGNPHAERAWLTVLRQPAGGAAPPQICDGPRQLSPGRNAGEATRLPVAPTEDVVLAVLTADEPPPRDRLQEALAMGLFAVFDAHRPLGQVVCRVSPKA